MNALMFTPKIKAALLEKPDMQIVVIGGRGWIGRACLEMLDSAFGGSIAERVRVFGSSHGATVLRSGRMLLSRPLDQIASLEAGPMLLAHFAFLTREKANDRSTADYVSGNEKISKSVEAAVERLQPSGLIMPSSGAALQNSGPEGANPYGPMKRRDEERFTQITVATATNFSCPRLFNLAGPFINKIDSYVLSSVICNVIKGVPIELRADRPVIRSYVHIRDLLNVCFSDCLFGLGGEPNVFETAGDMEIEVGDLAVLIADVLGKSNLEINRPALDLAKAADRYVGNPAAWVRRLHRFDIRPASLADQIVDTADYLRQAID